MQALSSAILFEQIPSYSREVHQAEDPEEMKACTLNFMRELASLVFKSERIVLNDNDNQNEDEEEKEPNFMETVKEEAERFHEAFEQTIDHFHCEMDQARSYSQMLKEKKNSLMSPRISILAQKHADSLTPQLVQLTEDINKVNELKDEVLEKVKEVLENGSDEVMHFRYHGGKKSSLDQVKEEAALFQPKVHSTRYTDYYLPDKVKIQNFQSPPPSEINHDK